jgi:dienelactone hydrolase
MRDFFKKCPAVVYCLLLLFVTSFIAWLLVSDGGKVKVRRISIAANDGTIASALIYIPPNAKDETPAPVVLNFAGRSTNAQYLTTWAMEQARRGFVVVSCDVWGNGQTEMFGQAGSRGGMTTINQQAFCYIDYIKTAPFIDHSQINIVGYSLGAMNATTLGDYAGRENISMIGLIYMPGNNIAAAAPEFETNWLVVRAAGDEGNTQNETYEENLTKNFGLSQPIQRNSLHGSYANKTAREYVYVLSSIHQTATMNVPTCIAILRGLLASNTNVINVDPGKVLFPLQQLIVAIAGCLFFITVIAFGHFLLSLPYFSTLKKTVPTAPNNSRGSYIFNYLWGIILPMLLFIPIGDLVMFYKPFMNNRIWRSNYLNGCFFPAVAFSFITLILVLILRARKVKAGGTAGLAEYCLAPQGENKLPWGIIGKSVILAFVVSLSALAWMFFIEGNMGINYQFWQAIIYNRTSNERFLMAFSYMPIYFFVNIMVAIGVNTSRRLKDTGNSTRDLVRDIAINFLAGFAPVCLLLCIQYIPSLVTQSYWTTWLRTTYSFAPRSSVAALDYAWNVPFVSASIAVINTFFYRKTGTIWPGLFLGTVFIAITVTSNFTLAI